MVFVGIYEHLEQSEIIIVINRIDHVLMRLA